MMSSLGLGLLVDVSLGGRYHLLKVLLCRASKETSRLISGMWGADRDLLLDRSTDSPDSLLDKGTQNDTVQ